MRYIVMIRDIYEDTISDELIVANSTKEAINYVHQYYNSDDYEILGLFKEIRYR